MATSRSAWCTRETLRPWAELSLSGEVSHIRTGLALEGPLRTSLAVIFHIVENESRA